MTSKRITAALLALFTVSGAMAGTYASAADIAAVTAAVTAAAQQEHLVFDAAAGMLTLHGEFTYNEIRRFDSAAKVTSIIAADDAVLPESCSSMFYFFKNCKKIDISKADSSKVTKVQSMFSGCAALESVDISGFDTSRAESMTRMFAGCSLLKSIDLSGMDTSSLKSVDYMFSECSSLTELDLSNFDFSKIPYKRMVFENCYGLSKIKLGEKTGDITEAMGLINYGWANEKQPDVIVSGDKDYAVIGNTGANTYFYNKPADDELCYTFDPAAKTLSLHGKVDREEISEFIIKRSVQKVVAEEGTVLPDDCSELFKLYNSCTHIDLSKATGTPKNMSAMFMECENLKTVEWGSIDTSKATNMSSLFEYCTKLDESCAECLDTSSVTDMSHMLDGCWSFYDLDLSGYDTSNVTNMSYMLARSSAITTVDLSSFDTSKVEDMSSMFYFDHEIRSLDLKNFDTSNVIKCTPNRGQNFATMDR